MQEEIKRVAELPLDWNKLYNKTLLISGGTGFIGSFLSDVFRYRNEKCCNRIKVVSLSRRGGESDDTVENIKSDITKEIVVDKPINYILHLASNTHPKQYAEDPVGTITTNIIGCDNLLKLAAKNKVERFLLASSVEIYGQGTPEPMSEDYCGYINCNQARSGYNEAKRTSEALCQSYKAQYGIDVVIVRLARVFGPDKKVDTKAISQFLDKAVSGEDIILKSNGLQRYSYVYVADAVSGILKVLLNGVSGEAYNIAGNDEGKNLKNYAEYIAKLAGRKVKYEFEENESASKATYALLSTEKIRKLGWKPMYSDDEGLRRTYMEKIAIRESFNNDKTNTEIR